MNKSQITPITTLYYRLYVTYFQANQDVLKLTNRNAFYRLSIYEGETQISVMIQGINPVILADKIFLNKAILNFNTTNSKSTLKVKLTSHFSNKDTVLGQADLDLQTINDNYFQYTQRFNSLRSITFSGQGGQHKLIFNIFVQKNKVDLDIYIQKFKQNERAVMNTKRYAATRKKIQTQQKEAGMLNTHTQQQHKLRIEQDPKRALVRSRSRSNKKQKRLEAVPGNSVNSIQINSAEVFKVQTPVNEQRQHKKLLNEIQEIQFQNYSSKMEQFRILKTLSYDIGSTSIVSDGSQQSQMIKNNLSESYSDRAVGRFKYRAYTCINIFVTIILLILLYTLLSPRSKIQKKAKTKSRIKISEIAEEIIDI